MLGGFLAVLAAAAFGLNAVATRRGVLTGSVAQGLAITVPIAVPISFLKMRIALWIRPFCVAAAAVDSLAVGTAAGVDAARRSFARALVRI